MNKKFDVNDYKVMFEYIGAYDQNKISDLYIPMNCHIRQQRDPVKKNVLHLWASTHDVTPWIVEDFEGIVTTYGVEERLTKGQVKAYKQIIKESENPVLNFESLEILKSNFKHL